MKNLQIPVKPELLEQFKSEMEKSNCNSKSEFLSSLLRKTLNTESFEDIDTDELSKNNGSSTGENEKLRLRILEQDKEIEKFKKIFIECDNYIKEQSDFFENFTKTMENSVLLQFSEKQLEIITKCYKDSTDLETSIKRTIYELMMKKYEVNQSIIESIFNGTKEKYLFEYYGYSREEFIEAFNDFIHKVNTPQIEPEPEPEQQ